jgi:YVTN family beta-propeller protein
VRYVALCFLIFFFSCTKDIGKVNRGNYPTDIGRIISSNCAVEGCHNSLSSEAASSYNLETWTAMFSGSANGSPVIPYNSSFSSLCYYINTYPELGLQNKPTMPVNRTPLSYDQVKLIKNWIDNGAPDINGKVMWADDPKRKKLYAVNQGCDVVTVFDSETKLPIRFIHVGNKPNSTPHHLRVSPDGNYWYLIFINENVMQKYRCSDDGFVGNIPLTPAAAGSGSEDALDWNTFIISRDGKRAYCVSWNPGKIAAVDLENRKLLGFIGGQHYPHGICLNAAGDKLFIAAQTGNFITEMDVDFSGSVKWPLENNSGVNLLSSLDPHDLVLAPDNVNLLITCQKTNEVRVFNTVTHSVTSIITTGVYPQEIIYSPGVNKYLVSCTNDSIVFPNSHGVITVINGAGFTFNRHIKCGYQPHGIAVDESKKTLYVLSRNISAAGPLPHHTTQCNGRNGFVNFVDLNELAVLPKRYELSVDPYFIFARP